MEVGGVCMDKDGVEGRANSKCWYTQQLNGVI